MLTVTKAVNVFTNYMMCIGQDQIMVNSQCRTNQSFV